MKTHQAAAHLKLVFIALIITSAGLAAGEDKKEVPCSLTGLNGKCTITIDRLNPITPSTVYVRHGSEVKVTVRNTLPFERLKMELKKTLLGPPPDQYQNGFNSLTQALSGLTVLGAPKGAPAGTYAALSSRNAVEEAGRVEAARARAKAQHDRERVCSRPIGRWPIDDINACQHAIDVELGGGDGSSGYYGELNAWSKKAVCMVHNLLMPVNSTLVNPNQQPQPCEQAIIVDGKPTKVIVVPMNQEELKIWGQNFERGREALVPLPESLVQTLQTLDGVIADTKSQVSPHDNFTVQAKQSDLHSAFDAYDALEIRMEGLHKAVDQMALGTSPITFTITEQSEHDGNIVNPTWDLNSSNQLAPIASRIKADKYPNDLGESINTISDAPPEQNVVELTIQFMNAPRFEISGGLVVPIKPYHGYSVQMPLSAANSSGTCPADPTACGVVAYTPTTAFIPAAMVNVPLGHEYVRPSHRFGLLATGLVGYSTASTSAVFGGGPSLSFGSFVFNAPIVWDRTQKLTGGYKVGYSAGTASVPTTQNVWAWSPSLGISIRVPIGGSSH